MQIKKPQPFTFEEGERAVLLLHGFTGHTADVRMLGRFLQKKGYTTHAPIYRGHGKAPEDLLDVSATEWWEDVQNAFNELKDMGYQKIAVAGLSLGGVLGLKLAYSEAIKGIIPMCTPMFFDNETQLTKGFKIFSTQYKEVEGKDRETIEHEVQALVDQSPELFHQLGELITDVKNHIDHIYTPTLVIQAKDDQMINTKSATYIYDHVECDQKEIKWYENAGHAITLGNKKEEVHEDIYQFLESLDWS
ncbi:carboxylesterase [Paraliobacillus quinghaiensis]|uniref:Carboxylesterase n=1 Tax=Paraliobacillus quinghaiensis TaxID=470815 RepID=A0A917TSE4_9BACI|nr:alpha/beta fold hydrolase [Paraliobacillus quinghaiensis]GGM36096.1 carboxylesterase [Paraliobacillus quinghaiensis]